MKRLFVVLAFISFGINIVFLLRDYDLYSYIVLQNENLIIIGLFAVTGVLSSVIFSDKEPSLFRCFPEDVYEIRGLMNFVKKIMVMIIVLFTLVLLLRPQMWMRMLVFTFFLSIFIMIAIGYLEEQRVGREESKKKENKELPKE